MRVVGSWLVMSWLLCGCQSAPLVIDDNRSREQLHALLWLQTSPEYRAAAEQTYSAATTRLPLLLKAATSADEFQQAGDTALAGKPPAIIMDLDETVLDNSAYNAMLVQQHQDYNADNWLQWVLAQQAGATPGALQFIKAARQLGYRVVFISNRSCNGRGGYSAVGEALDCPQKAATLANLGKLLGYAPAADEVLLRGEQTAWRRSDKSLRRQAVAAQYRIAMLVGDNLEDFIALTAYDAKVHGRHWGQDWFVLPNPVYGSWTAKPDNQEMNVQEKCAALTAWQYPSRAAGTCYVTSK
ncbi:MAG: HAD family acid phosphatase [Steroidobacteraceae bacterium]